jgi:hypothetical protein
MSGANFKQEAHAATAAYVKVGDSPVAKSSDVYMKGGEAEYFVITPGMKVSAMRVTTNGVLHVTELSA